MEINRTLSQEEFGRMMDSYPAVLVYFFKDSCGVCAMLFPKLESMLSKHFPKIQIIRIEAEKNTHLAAQLRMLTIPGILLMLEGKEYMRSNGMIALGELQEKINRYYSLMFGK
jgi:thioredoxin 1